MPGPGRDEDRFTRADAYIADRFAAEDDALRAALESAETRGYPDIHVSPVQGRFLSLLTGLTGARMVLEVGTFVGYSTIWLARALRDDGHLHTLELMASQAELAADNMARAGVSDRVTIHQGPAARTLKNKAEEWVGLFDLVFLDANKNDYPAYLDAITPLIRAGGLLLADNVVRDGKVLTPAPDDPNALGAAAFNDALAAHPAYESVVLQQVGAKGWDGLAIARKRA